MRLYKPKDRVIELRRIFHNNIRKMFKNRPDDLKRHLNAAKRDTRHLVKYSMRYPSQPNPNNVNENYYLVNSHGQAVPRKKFKLGPNRKVVFLSKPGTCIHGSVLHNYNFLNTVQNISRLKLFLEGRLHYLNSHVWNNAYKRVYKVKNSKVPNLALEYDNTHGVRTLPSGKINNRFNKPRFLSTIVNSRPGVYLVFACRKEPGGLRQVNVERMHGKTIPFKKHSHGHRMSEYENRMYRETTVKRKRTNNNNRAAKRPRLS